MFGDVLRSVAAPGNASSSKNLAWDGVTLWVNDSKNNRMLGIDPTTLTTDKTVALGTGNDSVVGVTPTGWLFASLTGNSLVERPRLAPTAGRTLSTFSNLPGGAAVTGAGVTVLLTGGGQAATLYNGAISKLTAVASSNAYGLCFDGVHYVTGNNTSPRHLAKREASTFTVVATVAAPANDTIDGLAYAGGVLWVGLGGATDRIYAVSVS